MYIPFVNLSPNTSLKITRFNIGMLQIHESKISSLKFEVARRTSKKSVK